MKNENKFLISATDRALEDIEFFELKISPLLCGVIFIITFVISAYLPLNLSGNLIILVSTVSCFVGFFFSLFYFNNDFVINKRVQKKLYIIREEIIKCGNDGAQNDLDTINQLISGKINWKDGVPERMGLGIVSKCSVG